MGIKANKIFDQLQEKGTLQVKMPKEEFDRLRKNISQLKNKIARKLGPHSINQIFYTSYDEQSSIGTLTLEAAAKGQRRYQRNYEGEIIDETS